MSVLTLQKALPQLRQAYQEYRLIPFIGAGFSMPLKLPSWNELVKWMGQGLKFDPPELFEVHGVARQLAGYFDLCHDDRLPGFIREMKRRFHAPAVNKRRKNSIQHQALAVCDHFRTIYTTNFEHHIEKALLDKGRKVAVLAQLEHFMRPAEPDECSIIKFHGDLAYPETVVLTESHFFDRHRLEAAPDQRLRADLLGNVFLFLGYSFSDPNIRYIWYRMDRLRKESMASRPHKRTRLRSYWVNFGTGLVQPRLLEEWHIDVIQLDPADKTKSVAELLTSLHA